MNITNIISNLRSLCTKNILPVIEINKFLSSSNIINSELLNHVHFENSKPCRSIIYTEPGVFSMHVVGFKQHQRTDILPYYNLKSFYVVLDGEIVEYVYYKPFFETRRYLNTVGCTSFITDKFGYHQLQNNCDKNAILFQIFT